MWGVSLSHTRREGKSALIILQAVLLCAGRLLPWWRKTGSTFDLSRVRCKTLGV
ncbi:hypothetical protein WM42_1178 [Corynebacterium simulans]|nr:hypothetical protein WM42_1178 [Corynebacterium simulans]